MISHALYVPYTVGFAVSRYKQAAQSSLSLQPFIPRTAEVQSLPCCKVINTHYGDAIAQYVVSEDP